MEIRKGSNQVLAALAFQFNALRDLNVGSNFHAQVTPSGPATDDPTVTIAALAVGAAAPTTEATRVALANDIKRVLNAHFADMAAHKSAQSAAITTADAVIGDSLVKAIALANACKAAYNTHLAAANVHHNNDGTNATGAADATNQGSLDTLLTELKADINAHILNGLAGQHIVLINA